MKIREYIYIAGYGHSGSTLLDLYLGTHRQAITLGEFQSLPEQIMSNKTCSCNKPYLECEFWQEVLGQAACQRGITVEELLERLEKFHLSLDTRFYIPAKLRADLRDYHLILAALSSAAVAVSDCDVIVDSSKTTWSNRGRIQRIRGSRQSKVSVIHLLRDPRAAIWSCLKADARKRDTVPTVIRCARYALSWNLSNIIALINGLLARRYKIVFYSLLTKSPSLISEAIHWDPPEFSTSDTVLLTKAVHNAGGNRMRRTVIESKKIVFRYSSSWCGEMPIHYKFLATVLSYPFFLFFIFVSRFTHSTPSRGAE